MKRLYIALTILLSSFLIYVVGGERVRASEYTYNITDNHFPFLDHFDNMKSLADNYIIQNSSYKQYCIFKYSSYYYVFFYPSDTPLTLTIANKPRFYVNRTGKLVFKYSSDFTSFSQVTWDDNYLLPYDSTLYSVFLYSSIDSIFSSYAYDNTFSFIYNNDIILSIVSDDNISFPSLYDLYNMINSSNEEPEDPEEPIPIDNTPILTSFYTLCIQKIGYFCEYMATNTLFLTILVIIILIFLFELIFRRRL